MLETNENMIKNLKEVEKLLQECIYSVEIAAVSFSIMMDLKIRVGGLIRHYGGE